MKSFKGMRIAAEEIGKYKVRFRLNGISTQAIYYSLEEVLNYLDALVENGGNVTNVQIIEERKLSLI